MSYHDPESYQTKRRRVRSRARGHVDYIFQEHAADTESETEYLNVVNGIYCLYYHGSNCKTEITDFISCPGPIDAYSN